MQVQPPHSFTRVSPRVSFNDLDKEVLAFWKAGDVFRRSVEMRPAENEYTFYDGPPFATGSPHYGHILQAVVKDIVPRYWTMRGYRVERRFGWDTHGLPVEMEVEKELGVSGPRQIADIGIDKFNEACRRMVETSTEDWEEVTGRVGRWVDFENDYKTMDVEFMESVWWVFRQLWDKGLVYQAFKVLPYSYGATTPLSNFEANMDYREVDDPAITVRLEVTSTGGPAEAGDWLVIWTTTPWTLPGNLAIAVGEDIEYAAVEFEGMRHWVAAALVGSVFGDDAAIVATATGADLLGTEYRPPFDYFGEERDRGAFRVISSPDTNIEDGTGLVHMAPAYGEADFFALQAAGLDVLVDPIDAEARFTDAVPDVEGLNVKDADAPLIKLLKESGQLLKSERIRHSYPFCWRTKTPLIYKAIPTWFVAVESFRDRLVEINKTIKWVPDYVGEKRFGNWLENARDWAISRNRYWGSCIPVWECDACDEQVAVGSRKELLDLSGVELDDLHKHVVDKVTFPCSACEGTMTRVPEVLDCWFESGAMPYAQIHYPFENTERFEGRYPAHFIAEGLDQTRGWFYTLVVLGAALFDVAPFQNCVVTGMILAEDGRKMSKSEKNYPDPTLVIDEFGGDALRAYLINSPVVRADPLRFSEDGVREVVRTVLLPLWNAYSFFTTYAEADSITGEDLASAPPLSERAEIDRWIVSVLQSLIKQVNTEMERYELSAVVPPMLSFIDDLTNWYIRRSRRRFWSARGGDDADKLSAFATLYEVLTTFAKVAAPVLPFVAEQLHRGLVADSSTSVHHEDYPIADTDSISAELEADMATIRAIVNLGRGLRKSHGLPVRQPLSSLRVVSSNNDVGLCVDSHRDLIMEELNVKTIDFDTDESALVELSAKADFKRLGPRLGARVKEVAAAVAQLGHEDAARLVAGTTLVVAGESIGPDDVIVERSPRSGLHVAADGALVVAFDADLTPDLVREGLAREIVNRIQTVRRDLDLAVTDRVRVRWWSDDPLVVETVAEHGEMILGEVLAVELVKDGDAATTVDVGESPMKLGVEVVT